MDTARDAVGRSERLPGGPPAGAEPSDDALLAAIRGRDDGALAALYDRHGRVAYGLAYRILGERGAAEDAVQEAFLSVWRHADRFSPERGSARAWLLTIVHHAAIDRRRGRRKRELGDVPLDDVAFGLEGSGDDPFAIAAAGFEAERVRRAMAELPREQQRAIELAFFGGLTHQEVAERTGEPLGTVKGRMRLGLRKLRVLLEPSATEPGPRPDEAGGGGAPAYRDVSNRTES
jgi:RNA polymerase sigma-70 factor (ECF subfamily)